MNAIQELIEAAMPFAEYDWYDAEFKDDNCQLVKHSGPITVGDWRRLRAALAALAKMHRGGIVEFQRGKLFGE